MNDILDTPPPALSETLNEICKPSKDVLDHINDTLGFIANLSGSGVLDIIENILRIEPNNISTAIYNGIVQLGKHQDAGQNTDQKYHAQWLYQPGYSSLRSLKAELDANPTPGQVVAFIQPCLDTLGKLNGSAQPDIVWNLDAG